jgi:hypothetical protein
MLANPPPHPNRQSPSHAKIRVLSSKPEDICLRQFVAAACSHPPKSLARRQAMTQLARELERQKSRLYRGAGAEAEHFEEAKSRLWLWLYSHLDHYDPSKAEVMTWINFRLTNDLKTIQRKAWDEAKSRFHDFGDTQSGHKPPLLDTLPAKTGSRSVLWQFQNWLADNRAAFQLIHIRDRPDLNCHALITLYCLEGLTFGAIGSRYNCPQSTISAFWYTNCKPKLTDFTDNLI